MFHRSRYSRAISADIGEIERRLLSLERQLGRIGGRTSAAAVETADRVGDGVASALSHMAATFRSGVGSMSNEAARFRGEAAKLRNKALSRLTEEIEHRPLLALAIAAGVGFLAGLASHRH
jgi:ElaB/YqjD/DUF883 family membrane-anchored ribosome-binding protein